jgi:perosamine synthetase
MSEIQAAIGSVQCDRLPEILENRRRVAAMYMERLLDNRYLILPTIGDDDHMSWFVFVVRLNDLFGAADRDELIKGLRQCGVGSNNYFPPIHLQPYIANIYGYKEGDFPLCEFVSARTIALPFHSRLTELQVDHVVRCLNEQIEKCLMVRKDRTL